MGHQEREERVGEMNEVIVEYMQRLGVSEAAKTEFSCRASAMKAIAGYESVWFHTLITQLRHTLSQILITQSKPLHIDLNLPPVTEASGDAIEDEEQELNMGEAVLMMRVLNSLSP
ncbi:uncharacterized protein LOC129302008 [Prosopis cineraria]|uniref:uncharacterized protein LOC129301993 n=1 Tax=Prosopis cineraria TaxID=364024 RepID=UPI00240F3971|nr:uncharacterized protein LOC129301993 [Prosopis cineraria]XP_054796646.1 uncharacterized protein LOC129302008 [Prosopis cineraria]